MLYLHNCSPSMKDFKLRHLSEYDGAACLLLEGQRKGRDMQAICEPICWDISERIACSPAELLA